MPSFYYIVICIAVILLILILTWLGIMINSSKTIIPFPPNSDKCPDFWVADANNKCTIPGADGNNIGTIATSITDVSGYKYFINSKNTPGLTKPDGTLLAIDKSNFTELYSQRPVIDFQNADWTMCKKKRWVNNYNVTWDGVSNYNSC